ncbi:MAG TPA: hypothetical protein VMY76_15060 [Gemmatimonadales bacterium]|nr:hypothetical protein [Gemmatimonadales bacterium]
MTGSVSKLLCIAMLVAACGSDRGVRRDSAAAPESTLFGDDRAREGTAARTRPDVAVLERLIDEYEGLDVVMDELAGPTSESPVQKQAWKGDRHEDAAKGRLLDLLQAEFGERYHPRTPDGAVVTTDSIAALAHSAGSRALDTLVLRHHRRVSAQIAEALPTLENDRVREELADLARSLDEEIRKLSGRRASAAG